VKPAFRVLVVTLVAGLALGSAACSCSNNPEVPPDAGFDAAPPFDVCDGTSDSFTRQAMLGILGRRPLSQAEVDVYKDLWTAAEAQGLEPRRVVAQAITRAPGFVDRWVDQLADALAVQRVDIQSQFQCWGPELRGTEADPALAMTVRDQPATGTGDGSQFSMLDLARSSVALDDLTPLLRAQIFAMMAIPIPAANVPPVEAELARRDDFGATFDSAFLHRDTVCLGCHNSEGSVTDSDDPVLDRHWPVPGYPEKGVYGVSMGIDPDRAHAPFRVQDFVFAGNKRPWNWMADCGQFATSVPNDPAGVDGKLASLTGMNMTVFDLDAALRRGFEALRGHEPPLDGTGAIADPDTALAWLVTLAIVEDVWREVVGTRLTIANYFPRNEPSSELLRSLATTFTTSGFSLSSLLVAIATSDYFDRQAPELACGDGPYSYPNVFDPWVIAEADEARRHNGPGDAVTPLGPRTLMSAAAGALGWPITDVHRFPEAGEPGCDQLTCSQAQDYCSFGGFCCTAADIICSGGDMPVALERGIGVYLRNSEHGFRGLDFQARLTWEKSYGACRNQSSEPDFIDNLMNTAAADPAATVEEMVLVVKDRLIGEPVIVDDAERAALAALLGGGLERAASAQAEDRFRLLCGALMQSPQFLMQGLAGRGGERPRLTPGEAGYDSVCAELAARDIGLTGQHIVCTPGAPLTLVAGRMPAPPSTKTLPTFQRGHDRNKKPKGVPQRRTPAPTTSAAPPGAM
jgi:hypothetical protein